MRWFDAPVVPSYLPIVMTSGCCGKRAVPFRDSCIVAPQAKKSREAAAAVLW